MKKIIIAALLALATSHAHSAVIYDAGFAVGIDDLLVDGVLYDVTFVPDSYENAFSVSSPTFLADEFTANLAANAIMAALNGEPGTPIIARASSEVLWVPHTLLGGGLSFLAEQVGHGDLTDPWQRYGDVIADVGTDYSGAPNSWQFAVFTSTPVPGPAPLLLLAMFLALSSASVRRQAKR